MKSDINELGKDLGLVKLLKQNIQSIQIELNDLKNKINKNQELNKQIKLNKNKNESLLNEIKKNTSKNNELLQEIKHNTDLNNQIKNEININKKNLKNSLKSYIDDLFQEQNQTLRNTIISNSEKLKNENFTNSIIQVLNEAKIYSNIIFTQGMIIAWYGYPNYIPKGWAICDGQMELQI